MFLSLTSTITAALLSNSPSNNRLNNNLAHHQQQPPTVLSIPTTCHLKTLATPCFTHTSTTNPRYCPKMVCPQPTPALAPTLTPTPTAGPMACPLYIRVTTVEVPCRNDCCPTTPTVLVTKPCPSCVTGCVVPTETVTVTATGCEGSGS
ncbi:hypothetical protein B0H65DRAFT_591762, partial [Neurospora tetraspora]